MLNVLYVRLFEDKEKKMELLGETTCSLPVSRMRRREIKGKVLDIYKKKKVIARVTITVTFTKYNHKNTQLEEVHTTTWL